MRSGEGQRQTYMKAEGNEQTPTTRTLIEGSPQVPFTRILIKRLLQVPFEREATSSALKFLSDCVSVISLLASSAVGGFVFGLAVYLPNSSGTQQSLINSRTAPESLSRIKRHLSNVWAGSGSSNKLPLLQDDNLYPLRNGDHVRTDHTGEGWLYIGGCQTIHLFQDSELVSSPNSKADRESGNATSLEEGSIALKEDCASKVNIRAGIAEIRLDGTWIAVTHSPSQQFTVVMVFDGSTTIRSLQDSKNTTLDASTNVPQGKFWYTTTNPTKRVAGLAPETPHSLNQLPKIATQLNLWKWLPKIYQRANQDNISLPNQIAVNCTAKTSSNNKFWNLRDSPVDGAVIGKVIHKSSFVAMGRNIDSRWLFGTTFDRYGRAQGTGWVTQNGMSNCAQSLDQLPVLSTESSTPLSPPPPPSEPAFSHKRYRRLDRPRTRPVKLSLKRDYSYEVGYYEEYCPPCAPSVPRNSGKPIPVFEPSRFPLRSLKY